MQPKLVILTWNVANLVKCKTREEELSILVKDQQPDVVLVSEAELTSHDTVVIAGYTTFLASLAPSGKCRLFALVKNSLAVNTVVLASSHTDIWLRLNLNCPLTVVGVYRQWCDNESADLAAFHDRCTRLMDGSKTVISGDLNLDFSRRSDPSYSRHLMASQHFSVMEALGLEYVGPYTPTYRSHGSYKSQSGKYLQRTSIIDHVYALGCGEVDVSVIPLGATDHMPVRTVISVSFHTTGTKWVPRRPLAKVTGPDLCLALEQAFQESSIEIYSCEDVNVVHDTIVEAITHALDRVAPYRMVPTDKSDSPPLFLAPDTVQAMRLRDTAARGSLPQYKKLRNQVCRLVRRDRMRSTLDLIKRSKSDPRKLWSLAHSFMGAESHSALPTSLVLDDGKECHDKRDLTESLNSFFIDKVTRIRCAISSPSPECEKSVQDEGALDHNDTFSFKYPSAGKIKAIILSLKNTGALGFDEIPVSVLKLGAPVLASPIAHLVRLSIRTAKVPAGFKTAIVRPIYKGKCKKKTATSSYRPIAILTAMSKVLERCVYETLTDFLEPRLPAGQHGFRKARSTTSAIACAHGEWSSIRSAGHILGVVGFDLTAAFDTLDSAILCSKLYKLGIRGRANDWFKDYLNCRRQCVDVCGTRSSFLPVRYGVPQGSILGPVLFLAMVADMPMETGLVGNKSRGYVAYADDICAWSFGDTIETVKADLASIAVNVTTYTASNYLSLSAEKTQILWSGLPNGCVGPNVIVNGTAVQPSTSIELLGATFDKNLSSAPFLVSQHRAAGPILATVRRLSRYLPPANLSEVTAALLIGKLSYAASATVAPRLTQADPVTSIARKLPTCINDAARTILGASRADKMRLETLLVKSGLPSLNRLVVKGIAIECWRAINTCGPLGAVICSGHKSTRHTRMVASGKISPPFKFPRNSLAWHGVHIWNKHEELRKATNLQQAKLIADQIAAACPL